MALPAPVLLALIAAAGWGAADFLNQRIARLRGNVQTLFYLTSVHLVLNGALALGTGELVLPSPPVLLALSGAGVLAILGGWLYFEAVRRGKLSVVDPLVSLEMLAAALFAFVLLAERPSEVQWLVVVLAFAGAALLGARSLGGVRRFKWEEGAFLALLAAGVSGLITVITKAALASTPPVMVRVIIPLVMVLLTGAWLLRKGELPSLVRAVGENRKLFVAAGLLDVVAWLTYTHALQLSLVSVVVAVSGAYPLFSVAFAHAFGGERTTAWQKAGAALVVLAVALASLNG